jgi:translation initiation factor 6
MDIYPVESIDLLGNSSIGTFGLATDTYALLPFNVKEHVIAKAKNVLKVKPIFTSMVHSSLLGIFCVGNNKTLLIPELTNLDEYNRLKEGLPEDVEIGVVESKISALGNTIVTNDEVSLIHPEFTVSQRKTIADLLDVEVIPHMVMNNPLVGSLIFKNSNGFLTHPNLSDDELDWLSSIFKTQGNVTTVNRGTPYPRPGIIANQYGALVGSDTTGPEMMRIFEILS